MQFWGNSLPDQQNFQPIYKCKLNLLSTKCNRENCKMYLGKTFSGRNKKSYCPNTRLSVEVVNL